MTLTRVELLVLGAILAAAEAVQLRVVNMGRPAHEATSLIIILLGGMGVVPALGLAKRIPQHIATLITAAISALQVLQANELSTNMTLHTIIAVVLVIAATFGFASTGPASGTGVTAAK